jgi:transmembrane sensor
MRAGTPTLQEVTMSAEDIERIAAEWISRVHADGSTAVRLACEAWQSENPRHAAAFLRLQAAWLRLDRLQALRPVGDKSDPDLLAPAPEPSAEARPQARRWMGRAAAAAAATLMVTGTLVAAIWLWGVQSYRTELGGFERLVLGDGTMIELNTNSLLRVRYSSSRRAVTLERGEASFTVAQDAARPFVVTAAEAEIRAVGTRFDVRMVDKIEVSVSEGRVEVLDRRPDATGERRASAAPVLEAGQRATIEREGVRVSALPPGEAERRTAWRSGMLAFNDSPLADVAREFNRYNVRQLVIEDPRLAKLRIGGVFRATAVEDFIAVLISDFGVVAVPRERELALYSNDSTLIR